MGSDCGTVGKALASDTRDPRFAANHQQFYLLSTLSKRQKSATTTNLEKVERHRSKESKENVSNDKCSTHQMIYSCSIYCHISEKVPQNAAVQRSPSMMGFSDYLLERKQCTKADSKGILMLNNQEMFQDKILLVSSSDSPNTLNFRIVPIISQIYVTLLVFFSKNHFTLELLGKYKNN